MIRYQKSLHYYFSCAILIQLFFLGGLVQMLGFISYTWATVVLCVELAILFLMGFKCFKKDKLFFLFFLFFMYVTIRWLFDSLGFDYLLGYELRCIVPLFAFCWIKFFLLEDKNSTRMLEVFFKILIPIQVFVLIIQTFFPEVFFLISKVHLNLTDMKFGTFFFQADATLAFLGLSIYLFALNNLSENRKNKILYAIIGAFIVLLTGSKAGHMMLIFVSFFLLCYWGAYQTRLKVLVFIFASIVFILMIDNMTEIINFIDIENVKMRYFSYEKEMSRAFLGCNVSRLAPIVFFLEQPFSLFGRGLFTYHDPLQKIWLYGGGHSLIYSTYIDIGFLGIVFIGLVLWFVLESKFRKTLVGKIYFLIAIIFSIISVTLKDFSFMIIYIFFSRCDIFNFRQEQYIDQYGRPGSSPG